MIYIFSISLFYYFTNSLFTQDHCNHFKDVRDYYVIRCFAF